MRYKSYFIIIITFFVLVFCLSLLLVQFDGPLDININHGQLVTSTTNKYNHLILSSTSKYVTKSLSELGPVPELSAHVLLFNRVPKTGSEMYVLLMQWLQGTNNFRHIRLGGGYKRSLNRLEQENFIDEVSEAIKREAVPVTFDRHIYFVNFTSFSRQSPTYINIVRDPVDKFISRFYYNQATPSPKNKDLIYAPKRYLARTQMKSVEKCVRDNDVECTFITGWPYDLTIPYFCGQDKRCMLLNDKWALERAKATVDRYYSVVGVLEDLNSTLQVFEKRLPYFFRGVQHLYFKELVQPHYNKNRKKPVNINPTIKQHIKNLLHVEYEFYDWIRRRLKQQLNEK